MAKGSDDITMTLKLEGKDIGPVQLNMQVSKKIAIAGGESGIMSATCSTTGLDVINRAAAGRTFVFVHNTGTTNAIKVQSAPADGSTYLHIATINAGEFGILPLTAATVAHTKCRLITASGTSTCNYATFEMNN